MLLNLLGRKGNTEPEESRKKSSNHDNRSLLHPSQYYHWPALFSLSFLLATISGPCSQRVIFTARIEENWNVLPKAFALQRRILTRMITVVWFVETIVDLRKFNLSELSRWEHFQLSRRMMIGRQNPETEVIIRNNSSRPASA